MDEDLALTELLRRLGGDGYAFVTTTPLTHSRVLAHRDGPARDVRDVLGWSLPFAPGSIDRGVEDLLRRGGVLSEEDGLLRSAIRVSSVAGRLFIHSAYPTEEADAVFLGPDSSRFVRFIAGQLRSSKTRPASVLDLGTGAGVGALAAAAYAPNARLVLTDLNPRALRFARINAAAAGFDVETVEGEAPEGSASFDLVLANPPFLLDGKERLYRNGGGESGEGTSLAMSRTALARLAPGGDFLLYSGSAVRGGRDPLREGLESLAAGLDVRLAYEEIDPDIFGEELDGGAYAGVDRIAAIGAVLHASRGASPMSEPSR